jgi:hypothetical protein
LAGRRVRFPAICRLALAKEEEDRLDENIDLLIRALQSAPGEALIADFDLRFPGRGMGPEG